MRKIIPTILIVIITLTIIYLFMSKNKSYEDFYSIGNDAVSSVNKITGLKVRPKINNIEEGDIKIFTFEDVNDAVNYSIKYANYLWKNEGYYITTNYNFGKGDSGKIELAKNSSDTEKVIRVNIDYYTNNSFIITLSLIKGSLIMINTNS